jgi:phage gp29-like protein
VVWERSGGRWFRVRAEGKPPEWFVFDQDENLRFLSRDNAVEGERLPGRKFLLARHHASYRNPYGERLLARAFWPVTFKKAGWKFWTIFAEKFGMPWVVGKVPRGANETERGRVLSALGRMVQDAAAVVNDDESIEFPEASGKSGSVDLYRELIEACNREISKAVLGQTLTTDVGRSGSYAAAKVHLEVRRDLVEQDRRLVETAVNRLLAWTTELNFAGAAPPVFRFFEEENVRRERAERDEILVRQGLPLSRSYYRRAYNLNESDLETRAADQD